MTAKTSALTGAASSGCRGDGFIGVVAAGEAGGGIGLRAFGGAGTGLDVALEVFGQGQVQPVGPQHDRCGQVEPQDQPRRRVTSASRIFAVLHSNRSGRYVRAVVPTTGSFTVYLNTTVTSATYVAWFVIN